MVVLGGWRFLMSAVPLYPVLTNGGVAGIDRDATGGQGQQGHRGPQRRHPKGLLLHGVLLATRVWGAASQLQGELLATRVPRSWDAASYTGVGCC